MRVTENEVIPVVDDTHGTERLKSADGRQVVVSYPSLRQTGETSNSYQDQLPAAIFVLEKAMAGQRTDKDELEQYLSMYNRENETYNFLKRNVQFSLFFTPSKQRHLITI